MMASCCWLVSVSGAAHTAIFCPSFLRRHVGDPPVSWVVRCYVIKGFLSRVAECLTDGGG
jgi:hypothetical protein